jgi:hypothetical protein
VFFLNVLWRKQRLKTYGKNAYIVNVKSTQNAEYLVKQIVLKDNCTYKNFREENVIWQFDSIERIEEILASEIISGTEIFSRFLRQSEVNSLKRNFSET